MSGESESSKLINLVEELKGLTDQQQADFIAEHFSRIRNPYAQVKSTDFPNFNPISHEGGWPPPPPPCVEPLKDYKEIQKMKNKHGIHAGGRVNPCKQAK